MLPYQALAFLSFRLCWLTTSERFCLGKAMGRRLIASKQLIRDRHAGLRNVE